MPKGKTWEEYERKKQRQTNYNSLINHESIINHILAII